MNIKTIKKWYHDLDVECRFRSIIKGNIEIVQGDEEFFIIQDGEVKGVITENLRNLKYVKTREFINDLKEYAEYKGIELCC